MATPRTFTFRLQKLLDARIIWQTQARAELQTRSIMLAQEQQKLAALEQREREILHEMSIPPGKRFEPRDRWAWEYQLKKKRQEQQIQKPKVAEAQQRVTEQEQVVVQKGIDVKALERLKEKKFEAWRQDLLHDQAVFLDDVAGQQFIRNDRSRRMHAAEAAAAAIVELEASQDDDPILAGDPT